MVKYSNVHSGLYHKPTKIVNDDSRIINKLETSLTDNSRVVIYDRHMFIVQATGYLPQHPNVEGLSLTTTADTGRERKLVRKKFYDCKKCGAC
jgi:hypothetical protein